jgi:hypothetical protein
MARDAKRTTQDGLETTKQHIRYVWEQGLHHQTTGEGAPMRRFENEDLPAGDGRWGEEGKAADSRLCFRCQRRRALIGADHSR